MRTVNIIGPNWEVIGERPIKGICKTCDRQHEIDEIDPPVLSPRGIAHHGADYGMTVCGKDATGPEWWWAC